jgi:hypothetical protein
MRFSRLSRVAVLALVAGSLGTAACFGSFHVTRNVWSFNKKVSPNKWAQELVFLAFNIIPVYGIAGFVDAVVVNSVEFWTGTNPVKVSSRIQVDKDTYVYRTLLEKNGVRVMELKMFRFDNLTATTTVQYVPGATHVGFKTTYPDGRVEHLVSVLKADGTAFVFAGTYGELLLSESRLGN